MSSQRYSVNQHLTETILSNIKSGEIAIPEIQRPFVWDSSKVRDLMDSLYKGYPIGYLIAWKNPNVRLKDGTLSEGKKVLIDGQQRVTALSAAILGRYIINKEYKRVKIKISFNPVKEKFEVQTPIIVKDKQWIPDISEIFTNGKNSYQVINDYIERNPNENKDAIVQSLNDLFSLSQRQIGLIELEHDLDIETVTEIFIRINSQGVVLSQADFVMSKIASTERYNGPVLRKAIDYFCHMAIAPEFHDQVKDVDTKFIKTDFFQKMAWLRHETEDLYDPNYKDMLRVSFSTEFNRGKLSDLVNLLSGRNFETRSYEETIAEESFKKLKEGIMKFMNETNFNRFLMIIKSSGFISPKMIRSKNAINFAYVIYLKLRALNYEQTLIETYVRRWFVMSVLTSRYSGSAESMFDYDIRNIAEKGIKEYLRIIEEGELSEAYWDVTLIQDLATSVTSSPIFHTFLASEVKSNDKGFLSKEITVRELITHMGDIHHLFPRNYLKKHGLTKGRYNQIANFVYMQSEINIKVSDKAPRTYFSELKDQANNGGLKYGGIQTMEELLINLEQNCIPEEIFNMDIETYEKFLIDRRKLMAKKIMKYYYSL